MATHGKNVRVRIQDPMAASGSLIDISAIGKDSTLSRSVDTADASHFGTQAKEYVIGQSDGTFTVSGLFDRLIDLTFHRLIAKAQLGTLPDGETLIIEYAPEGYKSGAVGYRGSYIPTGYDISGSVGDLVQASLNFQRTGDNTRGSYTSTSATSWTADAAIS